MVTAQDVHTVTFDKGMRGYSTEQVDQFLDQTAAQLEQDAKKMAELEKENAALKEKLYLLAQKIEEYRSDEDNLKAALLNAQRMGENVVREAKQKADAIEREAKIRAEGIVSSAADRCREEQLEYERIRAEVSQFKANVLSLYRQHIESLSTLPEQETEQQAEPEQPQPQPERTPEPAAAPAPAQSAEPEQPEQEISADEAPADEAPADEIDGFWEKDVQELTRNAPQPAQNDAVQSAFRGIRFSD